MSWEIHLSKTEILEQLHHFRNDIMSCIRQVVFVLSVVLERGGAGWGRSLGLGVDWGVVHTQGWPRAPSTSSPTLPSTSSHTFPSTSSPNLPCTLRVRRAGMVEGTCTSWGACRRGSRVRLGAGCGAAPQGAPCLVEEERWEEVQGRCRGSTCLDRELGVVSRRHPVCVARQASLARHGAASIVEPSASGGRTA